MCVYSRKANLLRFYKTSDFLDTGVTQVEMIDKGIIELAGYEIVGAKSDNF